MRQWGLIFCKDYPKAKIIRYGFVLCYLHIQWLGLSTCFRMRYVSERHMFLNAAYFWMLHVSECHIFLNAACFWMPHISERYMFLHVSDCWFEHQHCKLHREKFYNFPSNVNINISRWHCHSIQYTTFRFQFRQKGVKLLHDTFYDISVSFHSSRME